MAHTALLPCSPRVPSPHRLTDARQVPLQARSKLSHLGNRGQIIRLWQLLVAPGFASSEKMEIPAASVGEIISPGRARLGLSHRIASSGEAAQG